MLETSRSAFPEFEMVKALVDIESIGTLPNSRFPEIEINEIGSGVGAGCTPDDEPPDDFLESDFLESDFLELDFLELDFLELDFLELDFLADRLEDFLDSAFNSMAEEKISPITAKTTPMEMRVRDAAMRIF